MYRYIPSHRSPHAGGSTLRQGKSCIAPAALPPHLPACLPTAHTHHGPLHTGVTFHNPTLLKSPPFFSPEKGMVLMQGGWQGWCHRWVPARAPLVCAACCRVLFAKVSSRGGRSEWAPGVADRVPVVPSASLATAPLHAATHIPRLGAGNHLDKVTQ